MLGFGKWGKVIFCPASAKLLELAPLISREAADYRQVTMPIASVSNLVAALLESRVLTPTQVEELPELENQFADPRALARNLLERGWLTSYQVLQLFQGRGPGLLLGPYVLLQRLGQGGMGQVFKARHQLMNRLVALKVLPKELAGRPEALHFFAQEIQAVAKLSHPNIVVAHDAAEVGGTHFLVMEYVDGVDLARLVQETGPLPAGQACAFVRQASRGLQHAFERGLVHRDIKPANLLLTIDGTVKILDMGLARLKPVRKLDLSIPAVSGRVLGTPDYMAPEQITHPDLADIRADIYGMGCTLFFLLTGNPPFPEGSTEDKLRQQQQSAPPAIDRLCPDLLPGLAPVVHRMIAKRPEDRFQIPAEVAEALEPFVQPDHTDSRFLLLVAGEDSANLDPAQPTLHMEPPTETIRHTPDARPTHGQWQTAGGSVALLLLGILILFLWLRWQPNRTPVPSPRHEGIIRAVAYSPDGRLIASGGGDTLIRLWDSADLTERGQLSGHTDSVYGLAFSSDGRRLLSAGGDSIMRLWDVAERRQLRVFQGHTWFVNAGAFSNDGRYVLSGSADMTVRLWQAETGQEIQCLKGHTAPVLKVAFAPDGRHVLSASQDGTIRLWDLDTGQERQRFLGHDGPVWAAVFSPDGHQVLSAGEDQTIRLWDVADGKERKRFLGHQGAVRALAFAADGRLILSGGADHTVRLWDMQSGKALRNYSGHSDKVYAVAFSPDGRHAVSGGRDQTLRLWDLP